VRAAQIASLCRVEPSTIGRLEKRGTTSRKTFKSYIDALRSKDFVSTGFIASPLDNQHTKILFDLFEDRDKTEDLQRKLAVIRLGDLRSRQRPYELTELVAALEQEDRPAAIMDDLWFIHGFNGTLMKLYGIDPQSEFLYHWAGWHHIAAKFLPDSPVRTAHANTDEFLPPTIAHFLEDERTYPFLFTIQMRMLICRLIEMAEQHGFEFTDWWLRATSFNLPYELKSMTRTLVYGGQRIQVEAMRRIVREVKVGREYPVRYALSVLDPIGSDARRAFERICGSSESHTIFYAADYDENHDFHVNDWLEVKAVLESQPI
jgi:hypothetical protein